MSQRFIEQCIAAFMQRTNETKLKIQSLQKEQNGLKRTFNHNCAIRAKCCFWILSGNS